MNYLRFHSLWRLTALGTCGLLFFSASEARLSAHGLPPFELLSGSALTSTEYQGLSLASLSDQEYLSGLSGTAAAEEAPLLDAIISQFGNAIRPDLSKYGSPEALAKHGIVLLRLRVVQFVPGESKAPIQNHFEPPKGMLGLRVELWDASSLISAAILRAPFHRWAELQGPASSSHCLQLLRGELNAYLGQRGS